MTENFHFSGVFGRALNTRFFSIFATKTIDYNGFWRRILDVASAVALRAIHVVRKTRNQQIDMERCPNCQGRLTISSPAHPCARAFSASLHVIAAIEDPSTIAKILKHLGLPARAPPRAQAKNHAFYELTEFTSPLLRIRAPAALVRPCTSPPLTLIAACHAMINGLARPHRQKRPLAADKSSSSRPVSVQRS